MSGELPNPPAHGRARAVAPRVYSYVWDFPPSEAAGSREFGSADSGVRTTLTPGLTCEALSPPEGAELRERRSQVGTDPTCCALFPMSSELAARLGYFRG